MLQMQYPNFDMDAKEDVLSRQRQQELRDEARA